MKLVRFNYKKKEYWGVVEDKTVFFLEKSPFKGIKKTKRKAPLSSVKLLAPCEPSKLVLAGLNYRDHAKELKMSIPKEPIIFLKPPTTVVGINQKIKYPRKVKRLDYEAELAIVIKKKAKDISAKNASSYILGYTCLNDITARDLQKKDGQWSRAKGFDTFCPLGPWIETKLNPAKVSIKLYLNGKLKQDSNTKNFIFKIEYLVSFVSKVMTLYPGDVISTGTPPKVGPMRRGDCVEVVIEGVGVLKNPIV